MCMYNEGDYPEFYEERTIKKSKKEHECDECRRKILPGETYKSYSGKWNGDFQTFKHCSHCLIAADLLIRECDGFIFGGIKEDIYEHINECLPWSRDASRLYAGMCYKWEFNKKKMNIPIFKCPPTNNYQP